RTTVANMLEDAGVVPSPERRKSRTWKQFLKIHWDTLYACDFFSVEALGVFGTIRYMVLFVMELKTRAVEVAGIAVDPGGEWTKQIARNLIDQTDGFLRHATHLIHDRDPVFASGFAEVMDLAGIKCIRIPAKSPNCNPARGAFRENDPGRVPRPPCPVRRAAP